MQVQRVQNTNYNTSFGAKNTITKTVFERLQSIGKKTVSGFAKDKDEFVSLRQARKKIVDEYLAKRGAREMCPMISQKSDPWNVQHDTPLGILIKELGDDVPQIDKKYGYCGLMEYVNLADKDPKKSRSAEQILVGTLVRKCNNGGSFPLQYINESLGEHGIDIYTSVLSMHVSTHPVPTAHGFVEYCSVPKNCYEDLRLKYIAQSARPL